MDRKTSVYPLLKRLALEELPAHKGKLIVALICMVIAAVTTATTAGLIDPSIKKIFLEKDKELLILLPILIVGVSIVRGISTYGQSVLMNMIGMHVIHSLQMKMYDKLLHMDMVDLDQKHSGHVISSFLNDAGAMRDAASHAIVALFKESLTLIGCAGIMFYQDYVLASMTLFIFLPVAVITKRFMKKSEKSARGIFNETSTLSARLADTVRGMPIIRIYGREAHETQRAEKNFSLRLKFLLKEVRARAASSPITEAMTGIGAALAIFYAGTQGMAGKMELNNFMAFFVAMMMAYQPGRVLSGLATRLQAGVVAGQRVYAFLDKKNTIESPQNPLTIPPLKGDIHYNHICFHYNQEQNVIEDFSLKINAGEKIAFVGSSGCGKTTLLNLIPRFYEISSGNISIDGYDISQMNPYDLRRNIALVSQDSFLFDGTIKENILYGNLEADEDAFIAAAQKAAAYDFIMALPKGFDTKVGESGTLLSGGQKQRIAIARAFLKNAPILLLDEATSALDNQSEKHVQAALSVLMEGRTTLMIAHRLSTITHCDRIIVIDKGKILAEGSHHTLMTHSPDYQKLYKMAQ